MMRTWTKPITVVALAIASACAFANPQGPQVVSGTATFSTPNANTLNVTNSHNAIINWQSFNIGAGQTTNFIQPSSASAVLNRVISNNPSQIYGNLNSNGKVFLINQHGLMIGAGAQINTAGFYGSTLNITNEDFLKGNLKFDGGGFGGIQNHGYIHAGPNGNVVLIAPDIENGGVIEVDNGNVILAAGESIRITSLNDASIEFDLQAPDNGIVNIGSIIAEQGAARLFAGNLKHSGSINATGLVQNADGSISLVAQQDIEVTAGATLIADGDEGGGITVQSHHGDVYFSGTASARGETHHGGEIQILGDRVGLFGEAVVDASGQSGGGEVLVGGDFQGKGEVQTARQTQVGPHAVVRADAIGSGDGGKLIVWADEFTSFDGEATARGGSIIGNGGLIEVSGKNRLDYRGFVDASATSGAAGTVLFDPRDLTIQGGGGMAVAELADNLFDFDEPSGSMDSIIDPLSITAITDMGNNIVLRANRDIIINSAINTFEGGGGGDITFQAGQSILVNADIVTDNGTIRLYANDAGASAVDRGAGTAQLNMMPGITIDAGTGNAEFWMDVGVNGTAGNITLGKVVANHVLLKHNGQDDFGSILTNSGDSITALSVFIDHDGPTNGNIGLVDPPLELIVDNFGAHIHAPTTGGIYINATANSTADVTVGNTCYGTGAAPCDTFGPHLVRGLETIDGGGDIDLNVTGNLVIGPEPVRIDDVLASGNGGDILLSASGTITSSNDIYNNISGGTVTLNSVNPVTLTAGTYRGILQTQGGGIPAVSGTVTFDQVVLDTDAIILDVGTVNVIDSLDILTGRTLTLASTGMNSTLGTLSANVLLNGPGNIVFGGTTTSNQILVGANTTLTIGTGLSLFGQGLIDASAASSFLINNGTLVSDGLGLTLNALSWTNNGAVVAANNSTLTLQGATLVNDGLMQVDQGSIISTLNQNFTNIGLVQGGGNFIVGTGTFTNDGTVAPGIGANDTAILSVTGNYTQGSTGLLDIELFGNAPGFGVGFHDQLFVSGTATLDGDLAVTNVGGFVQAPGDNYRVVNSGTAVLGQFFGTVTLPPTIDPPVYGATLVNLPANVSGAFTWTGLGDGINWDDSGNWNFGVPTIADDVDIGSFTVLAAAGGDANTLTIGGGGSLNISGGAMTVANGLSLSGNLSLQAGATLVVQDGAAVNDIFTTAGSSLFNSGGNITNLGASLFNGGFSHSGGSATFTGNSVFNGGYSNSGGNVTFTGTAAFNGSNTHAGGTTTFDNTSSFAGNTLISGGTVVFNAVGTMLNLNNAWSGGTITGAAGPNLVLGVTAPDTTLAIVGSADKTLDTITLDMNQNDINMSGAGDLVFAGGAVIDNTGGTSFNHSGNGSLTGTGTFNNTDGEFNKLSGSTVIAPTVNFINAGASQVTVSGGSLTFAAGGADVGNYNVGANGTLIFPNGRTLAAGSTTNLAGSLVVGNGGPLTTLTLPGNFINSGNIQLNNATLDLSNLGGALPLTNGASLGGIGNVNGTVNNVDGVLVVGGVGAIGNLNIAGSYNQGANAAIVVEAINNGVNTVSDQLTVGAPSNLGGGSVVIGFTTNSLGLVTADFAPLNFTAGVTGRPDRVIDAGGNILFIEINGGVFTVLGAPPVIPDAIIDDLIAFLESNPDEIASVESAAEAVMEELKEIGAEQEEGSLVCTY